MNREQRRMRSRNLQKTTSEILRVAGGYEQEYNRGALDGERHALKMIFAGLCLVLHDECGFGAKRIHRVLAATEKYMQPNGYFTTAEQIDDVLEKTGIRLNFDDPFDPVERVEKC